MIPGRIENIILIIDCLEIGFFNAPYKSFKHVIEVISQYSKAKLAKIFVLNSSPSFTVALKALPYIETFTKNKIDYLDKNQYNCLSLYISRHQLENKYGGNSITKINNFFPPCEISTQYENDPDRLEPKPVQKINKPRQSKELG